jgi:hypothetical protein
MLRWLCSVVPCGLVHCDVAPMASCHMALECWGVMLQCCHVTHGGVRCAAVVLPCGTGRVRWTCQSLPRGMLVGPTCQVSMVVGPTWLRWTNGVLTRGTEVAQWDADTCHTLSLFSDSVCICLGSPVCTQMSLCPQVAPRIALIKSQPLIFPF